MRDIELYRTILGLTPPWTVVSVVGFFGLIWRTDSQTVAVDGNF